MTLKRTDDVMPASQGLSARWGVLSRPALLLMAGLALGTSAAALSALGSARWIGAELAPGIGQVAEVWSNNRLQADSDRVADLQSQPWLRQTGGAAGDGIFGDVVVGQRLFLRGVDGAEQALDVIDVKPIRPDLIPASAQSVPADLVLVTLKPVQAGEALATEDTPVRLVRLIVEAVRPGPVHAPALRANKAL